MIPVWLTDSVTSNIDRALHYTLLWGLEGVELRTVGTAANRVPFVNEEKLRRRLEEHEIPVSAINPGLFEGHVTDKGTWLNEIVAFAETARFCQRIGCQRVVVSCFEVNGEGNRGQLVEAFRRLGDAALRLDLTLAIQNEVGMTLSSGRELAEVLEEVDHPAVLAAWNPVASVQCAEDENKELEMLKGRISLVRCANIEKQEGTWVPCALDQGAIDWGQQVQQLNAMGFEGPLSLDVNLAPRPKQGLRIASSLIQYIRQAKR